MSMRINLNTSAYATHRVLTGTSSALSRSIEKLSSGFRINNAGDDPAGLVISEKLRAQTSGLGMAIKNANDAVNMVKTAEGALGEVHRLLRSMRDLAVHAANSGANDSATVAANQQQIANAISSINKIAAETQFGEKKLLDGSAGLATTVTGSATVSASFANSTSITSDSSFYVTLTGGQAAAKAVADGTVDLGAGNELAGDATVVINGVSIELDTGDGVADIIDKINAVSSETGVVASNNADAVRLTQKNFGSDYRITVTGDAADVTAVFGADSLAAIGADVQGKVTSDSGYATDLTDTGNWTAGKGLTLKDSEGNTIQLTEAAATVVGAKGLQGTVTAGTLTFQVGAYANQTRTLNIASITTTNLGLNNGTSVTDIASIDVTVDAQSAITVLDKAISDISNQRATLGATQKNVLESSINSLTVAKENISASESAIRDVDMAAEMVEFTRLQILNQAGIAMLAQANQGPQALLSLLR